MLLTSKGAAGVAGGGFIALTATLSTAGHIPANGIMMIFGIDKFMSECRALVNFCGNAVATLFIGRWTKNSTSTGPGAYSTAKYFPRPTVPWRTSSTWRSWNRNHGTSTTTGSRNRTRTASTTKGSTREGVRALRTAMTALRTARERGRPMKVLVAPDKFKGSLSAADVAEHLSAGLASAGIESTQGFPLADGGDGSVDAAMAAGFTPHPVTVAGATGTPQRGRIAVDGHHSGGRGGQHLRSGHPP